MDESFLKAGFEGLLVWQKSHQFVLEVYEMTKNFPESEKFGLSSQFRRAAVSIPSNIAESYGKRSMPEKARFFNIAQGSLNECRYYLRLSSDLGYAKTEQHFKQIDEIGRMLNAYTKKLLTSNS